MSSGVSGKDTLQADYIAAICKRIQSLLPNRTGLTIAEVELNPHYVVTKQILLNKESSSSYEDTRVTSLIVSGFCSILDDINYESKLMKLKDRNEKSLSSTLIVLKLLSEILRCRWKSRRSLNDFKYEVFSSNCEAPSHNSIYYHYKPPPPLDPSNIHTVIDTLLSLLSPQIVRKVLVLLRKSQREGLDLNQAFKSQNNNLSHHHNYTAQSVPTNILSSMGNDDSEQSSSTGTSSGDYWLYYINEIDSYIEITLRFVAASNPESYYDYVDAKLFQYAYHGEIVPFHILQKYSPLIKYFFYDGPIGQRVVGDLYVLLPYVRSTSWKLSLIVFYATSVKDQCFSRPEDYYKIIGNNMDAEVANRNLFDYVHSLVEEAPNSTCNAMILSLLSALCLGDFIELENRPNKLRVAFNRRLRFLMGILKDSANGTSLECFDSLITIFYFGAALMRVSRTHPIYTFSLEYLDETYESIIRHSSKIRDDQTKEMCDNLIINFFISAIMIKPDKYIDLLVKQINSSETDYQNVTILIKVTKGLSEFEITKTVFGLLMRRVGMFLKSMVFQLTKYIMSHEEGRKFSYDVIDKLATELNSVKMESTDSTDSKDRTPRTSASKISSSSLTQYSDELKAIDNVIDAMKGSKYKVASIEIFKNQGSMKNLKNILADLLSIFTAAPEFFYKGVHLTKRPSPEDVSNMRGFVKEHAYEATLPLKYSFYLSDSVEPALFDSSCSLIMSLFNKEKLEFQTAAEIYTTYILAMYVLNSMCEVCLSLPLTDPKFKYCFVFMNKFLKVKDEYFESASDKHSWTQFLDPDSCLDTFTSFEEVLLLSLCTHDVQFYNIAKSSMKFYCKDVESVTHSRHCTHEHLSETFEKVINNVTMFTGFVSLHKKFKLILRDSHPTRSLYESWLIIHARWNILLQQGWNTNERNLIFRHFTGFLVSTSGCFLKPDFCKDDPEIRETMRSKIFEFVDKSIDLLTSEDLVVRVVLKDALSMDSHGRSFYEISSRIMKVAQSYMDSPVSREETVLFIEQTIIILTSMIGMNTLDSFVLMSYLSNFSKKTSDYISNIDNLADSLRLKLRFCKLCHMIEISRDKLAINGAFKTRNYFAKLNADWLEHSIFYEAEGSESDINSPLSLTHSSATSSKDSDVAYLYIDVATECSRVLASELEELLLEIPEGIKDKDIKKNKDVAFVSYLSLFYRILQKYTSSDLNTNVIKSKYKLNLIIDNVLKSISNILQYDTDVGIQFVLPLGFHDNSKIRSIFLNVFANLLIARKKNKSKEELPDATLDELSDLDDIFSTAGEVAALTEHNSLASSLFLFFAYTKKVDKLLQSLLKIEISKVSRSSDIFRGNTLLTKLLSKFAKDYGFQYLNETIKPFVVDIVSNNVILEVEKGEVSENDATTFMHYLTRLVDIIIGSVKIVPDSFKFVCSEIYSSVKAKFEESAMIAVGSFIFLRFICPSLLNYEGLFDISIEDMKVKRTLMQLVKVLQNMANNSLHLVKWRGLSSNMQTLGELNQRIFKFLTELKDSTPQGYQFQSIDYKPIREFRYLHKFTHTYYDSIRSKYVLEGSICTQSVEERVNRFTKFDILLTQLGQPKALITSSQDTHFKAINSTNNFTDFMNKMSNSYFDSAVDCPIVHNSIFHDGTPVIVLNFGFFRVTNFDVQMLVYKYLELASHIWDNRFYLVIDFTAAYFDSEMAKTYISLLQTYAPPQLFKNCVRIYYFNIPNDHIARILEKLVVGRAYDHPNLKIFTYSQTDSLEIISHLCLNENTVSISRDSRITFDNVQIFDPETGRFSHVTLKFGRQWLQICHDYSYFKTPLRGAAGYRPVEVFKLANIARCEASKLSGDRNEFTIYWNGGTQATFKSHERQEILKFLYFATSRIPKQFLNDESYSDDGEQDSYLWFGRLYNLTFQSLLSKDEEVRSASAMLFSSLAIYYDLSLNISSKGSNVIAFPSNITDFIISTSQYLADNMPFMTYRFLKAFFEYYEKLPQENRLSAILYISPWVSNISKHMRETDGADKIADIIRQFCRLSASSKDHFACINEHVWKKLLSDSWLVPLLIDEMIAFTIDNKNEGDDWYYIISFISPSVEVCSEVTSRLITYIHKVQKSDSAVVFESKLFEIKVLIKICTYLFFNSYEFAQLFLPEIFFICTMLINNFIDDVGTDLQKLFVYTVQSFMHKPDLSKDEANVIEEVLNYFCGSRAKLLFGITREKSSTSDLGQIYIRITGFELLCNHLIKVVSSIGTSGDRSGWRSRWASLALDVAYNRESIFNMRAMLVVGCLSRNGISDFVASKLIKLASPIYSLDLESFATLSVSLARICEGLDSNSSLLSFLQWYHLCANFLRFSSFYQSSIQCFLILMQKQIDKGSDLSEEISKSRIHFDNCISFFEKKHNLLFTHERFEIYVFLIFSQGLRVSQFRNISLQCMETYFDLRYPMINTAKQYGFENIYISYLCLIYLSGDDNLLANLLTRNHINSESLEILDSVKIPKIITDYMLSGSENSIYTLIHCSYYFNSDTIDNEFKVRFLYFYYYLMTENRSLGRLVFHIVKPELENLLIKSTSAEVVYIISEISNYAVEDKKYSIDAAAAAIDKILDENHVSVIRDFKTLGVRDQNSFDKVVNNEMKEDSRTLSELLYRGACSYVEGERLED
ncbi:Piso0_001519 [Millerozyma farinosa CBS 7064]|uniref:Piso0_001519 protein n=1 Tax=Pichia sorbitophila (strain ATCC MYA-4447 / BCRC 22081 / CBS 7064 / NBRC 10061 / NRRL Y-12695) TaxID=559304 RepID=G8YL06_PICSO|nr:Piso0_001519 [Millerozyma farinosa CBS 7064]